MKISASYVANHIFTGWGAVIGWELYVGKYLSAFSSFWFLLACILITREENSGLRHWWRVFISSVLFTVLGLAFAAKDGRGVIAVGLLLLIHLGNLSLYEKSGSLAEPPR